MDFKTLTPTAQVLIENFVPGSLEKMELSPGTLLALNLLAISQI